MLCQLDLVVTDRPDVPARVLATLARRQGAIVALAFVRGRDDGSAALELAIDVDDRHRRLLVERIAALVDVWEVRPRAARGSGG
jgi:acetolactate synthase regulatory subunit